MNNSDHRLELPRAVFVEAVAVTAGAGGAALTAGREVTLAGSLAAAAAVEAAVRTTTDAARIDRTRQTSALLNHHIQQLKPAVDDDDHEIGLLWLPYFIFTIVLLGLIALSFVRFHCQRGEQYRKRQEELEDKMPVEGNVMNGREGAPPLVPDVPDHLSLFVQFTQGSGFSSPAKVNPYPLNHPRWPPVVCRSNDSDGYFQTTASVPSSKSQKASSVDGLECGRITTGAAHQLKMKQKSSKSSSLSRPGIMTTSKHPLLFTFNVNGSMVDIRCGAEERSNTFRLTSRRSVACTADTISATSLRATSAASATYSATSAASNTGLMPDEEKTLRYTADYSPTPRPRDAVFYSPGGSYNTYNLNKKQFYANNNVESRGSPVGSSFYYVNSMMGQAGALPQQAEQLSERYHQSDRRTIVPPPASVDGYPCTLAQGRYTEVRRSAVASAGGDRWSDNDSLLRQNVESS